MSMLSNQTIINELNSIQDAFIKTRPKMDMNAFVSTHKQPYNLGDKRGNHPINFLKGAGAPVGQKHPLGFGNINGNTLHPDPLYSGVVYKPILNKGGAVLGEKMPLEGGDCSSSEYSSSDSDSEYYTDSSSEYSSSEYSSSDSECSSDEEGGAVKKAPIKKAPIKKAPIKKAPIAKAPIAKAPIIKAPIAKAQDTHAMKPEESEHERNFYDDYVKPIGHTLYDFGTDYVVPIGKEVLKHALLAVLMGAGHHKHIMGGKITGTKEEFIHILTKINPNLNKKELKKKGHTELSKQLYKVLELGMHPNDLKTLHYLDTLASHNIAPNKQGKLMRAGLNGTKAELKKILVTMYPHLNLQKLSKKEIVEKIIADHNEPDISELHSFYDDIKNYKLPEKIKKPKQNVKAMEDLYNEIKNYKLPEKIKVPKAPKAPKVVKEKKPKGRPSKLKKAESTHVNDLNNLYNEMKETKLPEKIETPETPELSKPKKSRAKALQSIRDLKNIDIKKFNTPKVKKLTLKEFIKEGDDDYYFEKLPASKKKEAYNAYKLITPKSTRNELYNYFEKHFDKPPAGLNRGMEIKLFPFAKELIRVEEPSNSKFEDITDVPMRKMYDNKGKENKKITNEPEETTSFLTEKEFVKKYNVKNDGKKIPKGQIEKAYNTYKKMKVDYNETDYYDDDAIIREMKLIPSGYKNAINYEGGKIKKLIGTKKGNRARGAIVAEVMKKQGLTLPEASKYVSQHNLY